MKFYYVYILLCADGTFYTGMTNDLKRRFSEHQSGYKKGSYTFSRRPLTLKWYLQCTDPKEAIKIEKQIKGWSHRKKKALIEEKWDDLVTFSKNHTQNGRKFSTDSD